MHQVTSTPLHSSLTASSLSPCQGLAFIQHKNALNVREVEFARGYRLTNNLIEPIAFTVPRVKSAFFQVDPALLSSILDSIKPPTFVFI